MSLIGDFGDLLPDTVTITSPGTRDAYGQASAGTSALYKARIMPRTQVAMNDKGEEKNTRIQVIIATTDTILPESTVTLPNGNVETIWSVEVFRDDKNRHHHTVVRL